MRVFYLYDTFAHNGYTFSLISHPDVEQASLLIFVASFVLSDSRYLYLNRKDADKHLWHSEIFARPLPPSNFDMQATVLTKREQRKKKKKTAHVLKG